MFGVRLCVVSLLCLFPVVPGQSRRKQEEECVLFKANDSYARKVSESYIELGYFDVQLTRDLDIQFRVLPDRRNHNGPIFSIGTENFAYYEWKTKAVKQQFVVVEFVFSALATLIKALGQQHMLQMEIFRTYPTPYAIDDAEWHTVRVSRRNQNFGDPMKWSLALDDLLVTRNETEKLAVDISDRPAYLGARPGYRSSTFRGIVKDLRINGDRIRLSGKATVGQVEVWKCTSPLVEAFIEELKAPKSPMGRENVAFGRRPRA